MLLADVADNFHNWAPTSPNADQPLDDAKNAFILRLRRSNADYSAPTCAQVSSSVAFDADS